MYERMLNKTAVPTMEAFQSYCGNSKELLLALDQFMCAELAAQAKIRFPYGNGYGWGIQYLIKSKHFCDVFAEKDAFTVMIRLSNVQCEHVYNTLHSSTQTLLDNKYPCGKGGWVHARILENADLEDLKKLLLAKKNLKG